MKATKSIQRTRNMKKRPRTYRDLFLLVIRLIRNSSPDYVHR